MPKKKGNKRQERGFNLEGPGFDPQLPNQLVHTCFKNSSRVSNALIWKPCHLYIHSA